MSQESPAASPSIKRLDLPTGTYTFADPKGFDEEVSSLRQLQEEFLTAIEKKDKPALERMVHDHFTLVTPAGKILDKSDMIDDLINQGTGITAQRDELEVVYHLDGNLARSTASIEIKGTVRGRDVTGRFINTSLYARSGWQMIGNTLTMVK